MAKFQMKKVNVLLVTDLAARGIDIPLLDNVINVNFPAKSKLFVHRVGKWLALYFVITIYFGRLLKCSYRYCLRKK